MTEEHQTTEVIEQDSPQADPVDEHIETEVVPSEPNPEQSGGATYDAPNQQAVGVAHPSEEGTGGKPGSLEDAAGQLEEAPARKTRKAR
jgi:beta-lactam-binding protein with PASTA domain